MATKTLEAPNRTEDLNGELAAMLLERSKSGVVDIKCHVDVSSTTRPSDFKAALLNVFRQTRDGDVRRVSLSDLKSFSDLQALLG